jgi:hypothetical protein
MQSSWGSSFPCYLALCFFIRSFNALPPIDYAPILAHGVSGANTRSPDNHRNEKAQGSFINTNSLLIDNDVRKSNNKASRVQPSPAVIIESVGSRKEIGNNTITQADDASSVPNQIQIRKRSTTSSTLAPPLPVPKNDLATKVNTSRRQDHQNNNLSTISLLETNTNHNNCIYQKSRKMCAPLFWIAEGLSKVGPSIHAPICHSTSRQIQL